MPHSPSPLSPCPFLPVPPEELHAHCLDTHGQERGPAFYDTALHYAQSLWLQGFPARALLLLNRALGCELTGHEPHPLPYAAIVWLLQHHGGDQFIGNPRRHWQHLATRMSGPRAELRTWRAWACWRLACLVMPHMPADEEQLTRESLHEPTEEEIRTHLTRLGHPHEPALWQQALHMAVSSSLAPR